MPERDQHPFGPLRHLRTALQAKVAERFAETSGSLLSRTQPVDLPTRYERAVFFSPLTAGRRPISPLSTTVIVDDDICFVGSTELSRRGLTFDSSAMIAVVDEQIVNGVSPDILAFRKVLVAQRLGESASAITDDGPTLVRLIRQELRQSTSHRLSVPKPSENDPGDLGALQPFYDPDGRKGESFAIGTYLVGLATAVTSGQLTHDDSQPSTC